MPISEVNGTVAVSRINYRVWFWRVLAWDGVLPLVVWLAPLVLPLLIPKREEPLMLATILTAIGVFLVRWWMGASHIESNLCSSDVRRVQYGFLFAGLSVMLLTDAFVLGLHDMLQPGDWVGMMVVLSVPFSLYLLLMTVAMYSGREPNSRPAVQLGNWEVDA